MLVAAGLVLCPTLARAAQGEDPGKEGSALPDSLAEGRQNAAARMTSAVVANFDKYDTSTFADRVEPV